MSQGNLPFWLVNVPKENWPTECPDFLLNVNDKDRRIIGTPDEQYHRLSWDEVYGYIAKNRPDYFQRVPSDLRRYRHYTFNLIKKHGSIMNFIINERLKWKDLTPKGSPFSNPDDIKILYNDWPYGVDSRIIHLVVWTKFELEEVGDDITPETRRLMTEFMEKTFLPHVKREHIVWFKNWKSLKSVEDLEHFHVMLYDPNISFIERITKGDIPMAAKVPLL